MKTVKKVLLTFLTGMILTGCATLKDDVVIDSNLGVSSAPQLEQLEQDLVMQQAHYDEAEMKRIYEALATLQESPSTDSAYIARVSALTADYYLIAGNRSKAKTYAAQALKHNGIDEYALLAQAKCMQASEALDYTSAMVQRFPSYLRLTSYLGHLYYLNGDYAQSLAAFDTCLPFLPDAYKELYQQERNTAYQKYSVGTDVSGTTQRILEKDRILLLDMTTLANENTDAFNTITGNTHWKDSMLAERLKGAGWYRPEAQLQQDNATRKDAAIFLWHLLCGNDTSALSYYSNKYRTRTKSPIVDVPLGTDYFDASLAMVEKNIIKLIDGKYFSPNKPVSGTDFLKWLQKAESLK